MIKKPYTYLFYSIVAFLLFAYSCFNKFVRGIELNPFIVSLPLLFGIVLLVRFFVNRNNK